MQAYGEHFGVVTADAGLTAAHNAGLVRQLGKHYCFGLKANQPTLHEYAVQAIAAKQCPARSRTQERARGKTVVRELWTHALAPGEVEFPGARLLLLVRQQHWEDDGGVEEEYRYFVTPFPPPSSTSTNCCGWYACTGASKTVTIGHSASCWARTSVSPAARRVRPWR